MIANIILIIVFQRWKSYGFRSSKWYQNRKVILDQKKSDTNSTQIQAHVLTTKHSSDRKITIWSVNLQYNFIKLFTKVLISLLCWLTPRTQWRHWSGWWCPTDCSWKSNDQCSKGYHKFAMVTPKERESIKMGEDSEYPCKKEVSFAVFNMHL